jgi:hypothetical protein
MGEGEDRYRIKVRGRKDRKEWCCVRRAVLVKVVMIIILVFFLFKGVFILILVSIFLLDVRDVFVFL